MRSVQVHQDAHVSVFRSAVKKTLFSLHGSRFPRGASGSCVTMYQTHSTGVIARSISSTLLVLCCLTAMISLAQAAATPDIHSLFASSVSPQTAIYKPNDPAVAQRWTTRDQPNYLGAIKPGSEADVKIIVKIAAKVGIAFLATGGGFGTSITLGNVKYGLDIDLGNFKSVNLDAGNNLLTVGGAASFDDAIPTLYAAGKEFQVGTASCVNIVGSTLGAGVSVFQGHRGLLIDTLQSVRLVTAAGDAITVSKTENADLFWGLRGAGQNFGVVLSATYQVFDATNGGQVLQSNFQFAGNVAESIFNILKSFDGGMPELLAVNFAVGYSAAVNQSGFIINANYFGPQDEGLKYLQPFIDLKPVQQQIQMVAWKDIDSTGYFGMDAGACNKGQYVNAYSVGLKQTDVPTLLSFFGDLSQRNQQYPNIRTSFVIHRWPQQKVLAVNDDDTAYPYREIKAHV